MLVKRDINIIGVSFFVVLVLIVALQYATEIICRFIENDIIFQIVYRSGITIGTFVLIIPVVAFILRNVSSIKTDELKSISPVTIAFYIIAGLGCVCSANLLRVIVQGFGHDTVIIPPQPFSLVTLISCIGAAAAEEILFRKILLKRLKPYGNREAIFISAIAFALCHMNLWSFLFAFACGIIWGHITVHTGTIRYSCFLHMVNNVLLVSLIPLFFTLISGFMSNIICVILVLLGIVAFVVKRNSLSNLNEACEGVGIMSIIKCPGMLSFLAISVLAIAFLFVVQL